MKVIENDMYQFPLYLRLSLCGAAAWQSLGPELAETHSPETTKLS